MGKVLSSLFLAIMTVSCAAAEPVSYPDPSFETTGVEGVAHSGRRSGYLQSKATHWIALGGKFAVQPFARYRVTVWVKADVKKGSVFAPYCYEWSSFGWAFIRQAEVPRRTDWRKSSVTFVSPYRNMYVHPLALLDVKDARAWVDDITVEKIASPEQVIKEISSKPNPDDMEREILARYLVGKGKLNEAARLIDGAKGSETKADIAVVVGLASNDSKLRRRMAEIMVANGGLTYYKGAERFKALTDGMNQEDRLNLVANVVAKHPRDTKAATAFREAFARLMKEKNFGLTCKEERRMIESFRTYAERVLAKLPKNSPSIAVLKTVLADIDKAEENVNRRMRKLGRCRIFIGGKELSPGSHAVVIPNKPTPQEEHAAKDLRYHLELVTGEDFALVHEADLGDRTPIAVGHCDLLKKLNVPVDWSGLGIEGIRIKTVGPALVLAGNKRGVLYATYTFLEDYVGCRWFAPDCSTWPKEGTIEIKPIDLTYIPPLEYRATDYICSRDPDWAVRNKHNGHLPHLDEARGGHITYRGFVHTFNSLVPPSKYFDKHPEYFSMINGKRIRNRTQLCLTNPDVLRIATETVRRWFKESPDAMIVSVSQNDWHNYCQCPKCSALAEKEGSQSGPLLHFVNAIADNIARDYPDKAIDTLAYQYTRKPPKYVKPRPNVIVRLCSIECCFCHPLETDPYNASFVRDIRGWHKICNRLYIWDYVINYAHSIMPFPNLYVLKPNIQFFVRNGVKGIYEEANYYSRGAELAELRSYIIMKTLWDPDYDTDKAIDEFVAAYYGPAGRYIREYITLIHAQIKRHPNMHVRIYSPPTAGYLTPDVIAKSVELFDKAEEAVKNDPTLLHRVQVARLPIMYVQIVLSRPGRYVLEGNRFVPRDGKTRKQLLDRFVKIARKEGVTRISEGRSFDSWVASMDEPDVPPRLIRLDNGKVRIGVVPERGGRIWEMADLQTGKQWMRRSGDEKSGWDPSEGGYEEYSQRDYRTPGYKEVYNVVERGPRRIVLRAKLSNGLELTRRITLAQDAAELKIETTLKNVTSKPVTAALRTHPEFSADCRRALVAFKAGGETKEYELLKPSGDLWLRKEKCPAGAWTLIDGATKTKLVNEFDTKAVDTCYVNWDQSEGRVNLELWCGKTRLAPGQAMMTKHVYRLEKAAEQ